MPAPFFFKPAGPDLFLDLFVNAVEVFLQVGPELGDSPGHDVGVLVHLVRADFSAHLCF